MYNPAIQVQVPKNKDLGYYYFLKVVGSSPTAFYKKKDISCICHLTPISIAFMIYPYSNFHGASPRVGRSIGQSCQFMEL
jgi:hypothetical protein